ncbi:mitogen-activated protein kinase kinase kinase 18-like [Solanum pennellii]|uniref:Mitogen-activated protein kinase kinase kinase 18-like n=1 Tax=Solanum pennellii TaxID=28526 RepID=A0ABM1H892_SOLPN|nr:mitogen-activated protein kinase kinase kinase 18-like [Solanum pennellii]
MGSGLAGVRPPKLYPTNLEFLDIHLIIYNIYTTPKQTTNITLSKILIFTTNFLLLKMDWTRGRTIGHGSTAAVFVAKSRFSDEVFAVKSVELSKSQLLQKEQKILSQLSSPYIVTYKGYNVTKENDKLIFNLMMEYMPDGTLYDEIRKQGGRMNEPLIGYYTKQMVKGLEFLHSGGITHCDIKGQNILLGKTGAKIADFGCSRWIHPAERNGGAKPIGGTPMFMAPEVARGEEQGFAADIWGLGCTIIEMATGGSPWNNVTTAASLLYKIAFSEQSPEIPKFLSLQARDFLSKCLKRDPKERWTAKHLLKHPFLESNSTTIKDFVTSSPTSILDQDIWNSVEESETIILQTVSSPLQRVRELGSNLGELNCRWNDDERWITVRSSSCE